MNSGVGARIGGKEWWLRHIDQVNRASPSPGLEVVEQSGAEGSQAPFLRVARSESEPHPHSLKPFEEKTPKDAFVGMGLFPPETLLFEERVRLGGFERRIDLVGEGYDKSRWVFEFKIAEEERDVGRSKMLINTGAISEGKSMLYSEAYSRRYPAERWRAMPALCMWSLGAGSSAVVNACRDIGVTVLELERPQFSPNGRALRIHYLREASPRSFAGP